MNALVLKEYDALDQLAIEPVPKPSPQANEVLLRIHAAAVNDWDWGLIRGKPFYIRLFCGMRKPKVRIPGVDVSGRIEELGSEISRFSVGDAVYADLSECGFGGFAEYVCVPETMLTSKPEKMDFVEAASIPHAAALALQGLLDVGKLQPGEKLLINGAGGGVGTIAVQIARNLGLQDVVGVDHGEKVTVMVDAGFSEVVDYTQIDFTQVKGRYDLILDAKTNRPITRYLRSLRPKGRYVTVGGSTGKLLRAALAQLIFKNPAKKRVAVLALKPNQGLEYINDLYCKGVFKPHISDVFAFADIVKAIKHFGAAKHKGKVVVKIKD